MSQRALVQALFVLEVPTVEVSKKTRIVVSVLVAGVVVGLLNIIMLMLISLLEVDQLGFITGLMTVTEFIVVAFCLWGIWPVAKRMGMVLAITSVISGLVLFLYIMNGLGGSSTSIIDSPIELMLVMNVGGLSNVLVAGLIFDMFWPVEKKDQETESQSSQVPNGS